MSITTEKGTGDIVIKGFQNGIADDPYSGISDMRNMNIISIPGEASVNFSTAQISPINVATGTVFSSNAGTDYFTYTGAVGLENWMAVNFSAQSGTGIVVGTVYWVKNLNGAGAGTFQLTTDYAQTALFDITGNGTGTFTVAQLGINLSTGATSSQPRYFAYANVYEKYFMLDSNGALWSNTFTTTSGYWTYVGPSGTGDTNAGLGLVFYTASIGNTDGAWIFVFNASSIDYYDLVTNTWTWGWNPANGATHQTNYLKKAGAIHDAIVAPDNKVYFCDGQYIGRWYQASPTTLFVPTTPTTYIFDQTQLLPFIDVAQCLAPLGNTLLIGGKNNIVYPWDTFSSLPSFPILVAEFNIVKLVTVNTNCFIFAGNRGRIYVTNGTQASLYKKIPDHISGTVEPYYTWGGACSNKNQLYFSFLVKTNGGSNIVGYGGVWAVDLDTKAIRLTNQLSYQFYTGYASALIPNFSATASGNGLFAGWDDSTFIAGTYGIDTTLGTPYTNASTLVRSDLIPIGTFLKPTNNGRVEFKLAVPLVAGESITLSYRQAFSDSFTNITNGVFNTVGIYSGVCQTVNFKNSQWIQIQAITVSTANSPSYVRLTELRLGS